MTRPTAALAAIAITVTSLALAAPRTEPARPPLEFLRAYLDDLERAEPSDVRRHYADDGRFAWFTDGVRRYDDADAVARGLEEVRASGVRLRTALENPETVELAPGLVAVRAGFKTSGLTPGGDEAFAFAGVMTLILERDGRGAWRIVQGHSSTPAGPPAGNDPKAP